jgi:hypothetical protein
MFNLIKSVKKASILKNSDILKFLSSISYLHIFLNFDKRLEKLLLVMTMLLSNLYYILFDMLIIKLIILLFFDIFVV